MFHEERYERCKGIGKKRRNYPKRSERKIVEKDYFTIKQEIEDAPEEDEVETQEEEVDEEYEDEPEEYVPNENEMKMALESKVFGAHMPKSVRTIRPQRFGLSDRTGRGGRNELSDVSAPEPLVMGAVEYMLGNRVGDEDGSIIQASLNLASLFRKKGRRRKQVNIDFDNLSDEDEEFKGPFIQKKDRVSGDRVRKSRRLNVNSDNQKATENSDEDHLSNTENRGHESSQLTRNIKQLLEAGKQKLKGEDAPEKPVEQTSLTKFVATDHCYPVKDENEKSDDGNEQTNTPTVNVNEEDNENLTSKTSSDDESPKKERLRRGRDTVGRDSDNKPASIEENTEEVEEMIRSSSRASRPSSQADSRPGSELGRPGSVLPKKVARQLESLGSPDRDSPVLTPRQRQTEREAREREGFDSLRSSRVSTPAPSGSKSPARAALINENYLKKDEVKDVKETENIGNFSQAFARKRQTEKVKKMLEKQRKKAEKLSN